MDQSASLFGIPKSPQN
ncbi:hypothetical protein F383_25993 [Gossypium arboreum]|uniref:Uncharacterized protein n=1 Tax=Gossypium arboreum TaxID=29729 RepID=A0A0B0NZM7_GOSAR|nr:hypothetical protein F383_25993 [Gossypium arboreum]